MNARAQHPSGALHSEWRKETGDCAWIRLDGGWERWSSGPVSGVQSVVCKRPKKRLPIMAIAGKLCSFALLLMTMLTPIECSCKISAAADGAWSAVSTWGGASPASDRAVDVPSTAKVTVNGAASAAVISVKAGGSLKITTSGMLAVVGGGASHGGINGACPTGGNPSSSSGVPAGSSSSSDDNTSVLAIALVVVAVGVVVYALGLYGMYRSLCQDFASIGKENQEEEGPIKIVSVDGGFAGEPEPILSESGNVGIAMAPSEGGDNIEGSPEPGGASLGAVWWLYMCAMLRPLCVDSDEKRRAKAGTALVETLNDHEQYVLAARLELLWEMPINAFENYTAEEKLEELKAGAAEAKVIKEEVEELGLIDGEQTLEAEVMELENLMREFSELIDATAAKVERLATAQPPPEAPSKVRNETIAKFKEKIRKRNL